MIKDFLGVQRERLDILDDYSKGNNTNIRSGRRRIEQEKADYRVSHNLGGYSSNFITGYTFGKPITIGYEGSQDDGDTNDLAEIREINEYNDADNLNYELGFDASRYGRAFELHYRCKDKKDNIVLIDPKEIFTVRDLTVRKNVIGAVHLPLLNGEYHITIYTDSHIVSFNPTKSVTLGSLTEKGRKKHSYNDVPVVEWQNNRHRAGDWENEIPIIDAYDAAESDTANYMSDLNDALLVLKGDLKLDELGTKSYVQAKQANMVLLESGMDSQGRQTNVDANYIYKQYDVAGTEAYKTRLMQDYFKLTNTPNVDDQKFYTSVSGVALRYRMIGLQQLRKTKESFYTKALRRRYQLIESVHKEIRGMEIDSEKLTFTFHENLPEDVWEEIKLYMEAGGEISQETLREHASFTDHKQEQDRLANESVPFDAPDQQRSFALRGADLFGEEPATEEREV